MNISTNNMKLNLNKSKIIEKDEEFLSLLGAESGREKDKNELIRQMRRYLKGFN